MAPTRGAARSTPPPEDTTESAPAAENAEVAAENAEVAAENAEVAAENAEVAAENAELAPVSAVRPFISEGTRQDLELHGKATDPVTGNMLKLNRDTGEVTVTERDSGKVTMADVAPLNPA